MTTQGLDVAGEATMIFSHEDPQKPSNSSV